MNLQKVIIDAILDEAITTLDELYHECEYEFKNSAKSGYSRDYLSGRCDAIDLAMTKISELKNRLEKDVPPLQ